MRPHIVIFVIMALDACSATEVTRTAWSASPKSEWLTRIERSDTDGPGNNSLTETIQLKRPTMTKPVDILSIDEDYGPATITLYWRDPTHLTIQQTGGKVVFQVVKVGELSIETIGTNKS